jgi:hypothetical protein
MIATFVTSQNWRGGKKKHPVPHPQCFVFFFQLLKFHQKAKLKLQI